MTTAIVQKGAVISIGSELDANISVIHNDGTVNRDCISVARLPTGEKCYHYILQDGDIVLREVTTSNPSLRQLKLDTVELKQSGDRYTATLIAGCNHEELSQKALEAYKDSNLRKSLNMETVQTLIGVPGFASLLTHGAMSNIYGHPIDFLLDSVGILFEKLDDKETVGYRGNVIQSTLTIDKVKNRVVHDTFVDLGSLTTTSYYGTDNSLLLTRSLKHAMRLTIASHSADNLSFAQKWFEKIIHETGHAIRKTKTKRGELIVVLPKISQKAAELCKTLG